MSDYLGYGLMLEGHFYSKKELLGLSALRLQDNSLSDWEKFLYEFLQDWYNDNPDIELSTSGTTGKPKEIFVPKKYLVNSALNTGKFLSLTKGMTALLCLSPGYIAGKMMVVRSMVLEMNLILSAPVSDPLHGTKDCFDFAAMVPLQISKILEKEASARKLREIKKLIIGGARLNDSVLKQLRSFPNEVYETYGMTETLSHIAMRRLSGAKSHKYFRLMPGVKISTDDKNCLEIDAPEISSARLVTNDKVNIINSDEFEFLGRQDRVINTGGIKVFPDEIEKKIASLIPGDYKISSVPDERLGEKLVLIIERIQMTKAEVDSLQFSLQEVLNEYEVPREIRFADNLKVKGID